MNTNVNISQIKFFAPKLSNSAPHQLFSPQTSVIPRHISFFRPTSQQIRAISVFFAPNPSKSTPHQLFSALTPSNPPHRKLFLAQIPSVRCIPYDLSAETTKSDPPALLALSPQSSCDIRMD